MESWRANFGSVGLVFQYYKNDKGVEKVIWSNS